MTKGILIFSPRVTERNFQLVFSVITMKSLKLSELIIIFQLYGVVTLKTRLSYCFTFLSFLLTLATIWFAYAAGHSTFFKIPTLSGVTRSFSYILLYVTRSLVLLSSILNVNKFHKIIDEFDSFDRAMLKKFKINVNTKSKFIFLATKLIILLATLIIIPSINLALPKVNRPLWIILTSFVHILHAKKVSLVFFVDSLNHRMEMLTIASRKGNLLDVLALHSRLWTASKLINDSHNIIILTLAQNCFGVLVNLFHFFLLICNYGFVSPISRKLGETLLVISFKRFFLQSSSHHLFLKLR